MLRVGLALILLVASGPVQTSSADQGLFSRTRQVIARWDRGHLSRRVLERLLPRKDISGWRRLQRVASARRPGYADVTLMLAYYGVDFKGNLARLLVPYERWRRVVDSRAWSTPYDRGELEELPAHLALLCRKAGGSIPLERLLDLRLSGEYAHNQSGALADLWQDRPRAILRVADDTPTRLTNVSNMLEEEFCAERAGQARVFTSLQHLARTADVRVARAARRVELLLTADLRRNGILKWDPALHGRTRA
jgi:hypothetical protein